MCFWIWSKMLTYTKGTFRIQAFVFKIPNRLRKDKKQNWIHLPTIHIRSRTLNDILKKEEIWEVIEWFPEKANQIPNWERPTWQHPISVANKQQHQTIEHRYNYRIIKVLLIQTRFIIRNTIYFLLVSKPSEFIIVCLIRASNVSIPVKSKR